MKNTFMIWLIVALCLIIIGAVLVVSVLYAKGWDLAPADNNDIITKTYTVTEPMTGISIRTDTADISFAVSEDETCKVVCTEHKNITYSVSVDNGVLTIEAKDTRKWYEYLQIISYPSTLTVYLPQQQYASLHIQEATGDIEIPEDFQFIDMRIITSTGSITNRASVSDGMELKTDTGMIFVNKVSAGSVSLTTSTGKIHISDITCQGNIAMEVNTGKTVIANVTCENITALGDTGAIHLENVIANGALRIERNTGRVKMDHCDASEIHIKTDTGDISGSLLTDKIFVVQTETGRANVPRTTTGGICEIISSTGDITITIN